MPVEEIARGSGDLVRAGKMICTGFSNFPAWRVGITEPLGVRIKPVAILAMLNRRVPPATSDVGQETVAAAPDHQVSDGGECRPMVPDGCGTFSRRSLTLHPTRNGDLTFSLNRAHRKIGVHASGIVLKAFAGPPPTSRHTATARPQPTA